MTAPELVYHPLIIPSVVIPFTALLAALSAFATFIAGLFGFQLHAEGPRKLLEVMLKPKILASALALNIVLIGGVAGYQYWKNSPVMLWRIQRAQNGLARPSHLSYPDSPAPSTHASRAPQPGMPEPVWTLQLQKGSFRGAVPSGESLFVGSDDGTITELSQETGQEVRRFFLGTAVSAPPLIFKGALYAGEGVHDTHHARVYKFSLATGHLEATFTSIGHIEGELVGAMLGDRPVIVVPTGKGGIVALDAGDLSLLWQANDGHTDAGALASGSLVFAGTGMEKENPKGKKGEAFAYELATGKKIWSRELPASSWMQPIAWRDQVCFVFGEVYFKSDLGGFYCFRASDGQPGVAYNNAAPIAANPQLLGDDLVVSDFHGKVCRVSLENGKSRWCRETGEAKAAFSNPVLDPRSGTLLYASFNNGLFVLDPASGQPMAHWKPNGASLPWAKTFASVSLAGDSWVTVDMKGLVRKLRWRPAEKSAQQTR